MKKYYTILLLLILSSCDSFFHEVDDSCQKVDTQQEKDDMINGIYARLVEVHNGDYFTVLGRSDDVNDYYRYSFPNGGGAHIPSNDLDYGKLTDNIYMNLYVAIININKLLCDLSGQDDKKLLGELYFLRAYCHFKLARLFGTPPLVEDVVVNFYLKKPSYRDVYEFIEKDMLKALELLPDTYTDARIPGETPHKGTAKALLAEIYLAMAGYPVKDESKYAEAARLSGEVIEQAEYYNFALQNDFAALWDEDNKHDKENIFGLFFTTGSENNWNKIGKNSLVITSKWISPRNYDIGIQSSHHPELKFYADFPDNYRKIKSFVTGSYKMTNYMFPDTTIYSLQFVRLDPYNSTGTFLEESMSLKWVGNYQKYATAQPEIKTGNTLYLLRYAQTLLTYAESKARSGSLDQSAYEAVNKIRRRANKLDLNAPSKFDLPANLTKEQFIDSVVWERAWELNCEPDGRWFDIIRLNLKDKLKEYRSTIEQPDIVSDIYLTDDWYFYKIPQEDRWANPNFE